MSKGFCVVASFNQTVPSRSALFFAYLRFAVSRVLLLLSCAVMQVRVCERAFLCALCLSPADCLACECRLNEKVKGSLRRTNTPQSPRKNWCLCGAQLKFLDPRVFEIYRPTALHRLQHSSRISFQRPLRPHKAAHLTCPDEPKSKFKETGRDYQKEQLVDIELAEITSF